MERILCFLSGKKGIIATVLGLTNGYLFQMEVYTEPTFLFIGALLVALFGSASMMTKNIYKK